LAGKHRHQEQAVSLEANSILNPALLFSDEIIEWGLKSFYAITLYVYVPLKAVSNWQNAKPATMAVPVSL
jgi:hypothetical protein